MYFRLLVGISILFVLKDWYRIEVLKKSIDHKRGFLLRSVTCIAIALVMRDDPGEIIKNLICTPVIMGFIFQYGLNIVRRKSLVYLNPTSNRTDYWLLRIFRYKWLIFTLLAILFVGAIIWKLI